jgi:hypothetical protein
LLERVTDNQYGIFLDGTLRHLPGGVDQYLAHNKPREAEKVAVVKTDDLSGAERRSLEKESARLERLIAKQQAELLELQLKLAQSDPADYQKLVQLSEDQQKLQKAIAENEESWLLAAQKLQG